VTDGDGNTTTIQHDGSGNPTAIVAPFGQRTTLSVDANGYLAHLTNPAGEAVNLTSTPNGLLTGFTDPRGNTSHMSYDTLGRLVNDTDAAGGTQALVRTDVSQGYQITRQTALGRVTTYQTDFLSTGDTRRVLTLPDGTQTTTLLGANGTTTTTPPDGTITTQVAGPDPRFGMQASLPTSLTITTPGGLQSTLTTARTVALANPLDPFSLTTLRDTVTLNGRTFTSLFNAATKTTTTTSAAGRQSTVMIDAQSRPVQTQVPGLFASPFTYDPQGRLVSMVQGTGTETRQASFSYTSAGYLDTITDPLGHTVHLTHDAAGRVTQQTLPDGRTIPVRL